jgi:hypothetical protein
MKLVIANIEIHQDAEGRYSLNDFHKAAGEEKSKGPSYWLETQQAKDIAQLLSDTGIPVSVKRGGSNQGTYACKELVYSYAMWISAEFHLKVVRTFDAVVSGDLHKAERIATGKLDTAPKLFPPFFRIARLMGCDKNAAAISANQAVAKLTGTNVLALLGQIHIEAENQTALYFTPTELGERMNISGRKFNMLLAEAGLQAKKGEHWTPLPAAEGFSRIMDTGKRHGDGTMIQQVKWAENVLALVEKAAA